jgi:hypothetical protein
MLAAVAERHGGPYAPMSSGGPGCLTYPISTSSQSGLAGRSSRWIVVGPLVALQRPLQANHDTCREGTARISELAVRIGGTYPLDEAARALEDLAVRRTTRKLLLLPH